MTIPAGWRATELTRDDGAYVWEDFDGTWGYVAAREDGEAMKTAWGDPPFMTPEAAIAALEQDERK